MGRRWFIVGGAVILIAAVALLVWWQINIANASRPQFSEADIALARKGDLIATVSATGSIESQTVTSLAFLESGRMAEVLVDRGDKVTDGQTLARLDTTALELQLAQAEANLASAEAALEKLQAGPAESAQAAAQANLTSAQAAYDALKDPSPSAIAAAQANYTAALAELQALNQPDPTTLAIAKADVDKAKAAVAQAQAAFDRIGGATNPIAAQSPQALQLQSATLDYEKALNAFNGKFQPGDAQLKAAAARIEQAKEALDRLEATPDNLARAEAQIKQSQDALARLDPTTQDLKQAEANAASARAARDLAQERLKNATIVAPGSGTITQVNFAVGAFAQTGLAVITLADLDNLEITLSIDETDIPRVQVAQPVLLDLDAFPGAQVEGVVREIAPAATTLQGVVNYPVRIELQPTTLAIKPGMTANASVQVARQENVLLVPTRSIRAQGSRRLVTILENGVPTDVVVTLGLSNEQDTEIQSGLDEGAQVLTIALPSNSPSFGR